MTQTQFEIPTADPHFILQDEHIRLLEYVAKRRQDGKITNILIKGPQGSGKSSTPIQFAAKEGAALVVIEIGLLSESAEIYGHVDLKDGQTIYTPGLFTLALQTPGTVIHLQEINRPESDKTLNALFSVLDPAQRKIWVDGYGYIKVASGVTFFASLNEGYEFVGTMPVDQALEDRFSIKMQFQDLPQDECIRLLVTKLSMDANKALELVKILETIRANVQDPLHISVRNLLAIGELMIANFSIIEAVKSSLVIDKSTLEAVLTALHFTGHDSEYSSKYRIYTKEASIETKDSQTASIRPTFQDILTQQTQRFQRS